MDLNIISHKNVATSAAVIFILMSVALTFFPGLLIWQWGIVETPEAAVLSKRLAASLLGFAVICSLTRGLPLSDARRAVSMGLATALIAGACFAAFELLRGNADAGIVLAIMIEVVFGMAFLLTAGKE